MSKLYLLTGPAGVGKSTISYEIATSLSKSVLIEGDDIYNQFIGGRISPWKDNAPLDLFWENCLSLIDNYLKKDYDVVFNYIIKKDRLNVIINIFKEYDVKFACLMVDEKILLNRDKQREEDCQMGSRCITLLNEFKNELYDDKYIIDTSNLGIKDIVNLILDNDNFLIS